MHFDGCKMVPTTEDVWLAIRASHQDLALIANHSTRTGQSTFGNGQCEEVSAYGLPGAPHPLISIKTTWSAGSGLWLEQENVQHEYWLYYAENVDE